MDIAPYIDHTVLKPTTTAAEIRQLCAEAAAESFAAVCVPPCYVSLAATLLRDTRVKTATVIGFPFGYSAVRAKIAETEQALADGAGELDMVINLAALKNGDWRLLEQEIHAVITPVHQAGKIIKVIVESGLLTDEELIRCCKLYSGYNIDFMKTSTGYAATGATLHAVNLMRQHLPPRVSIKASGGIRNFAFARELITAGATRLGCSASMQIVAESRQE